MVEGKTERKPKYEAYDDYYIIRYGNNKQIKITEEELSRFKKLYCGTHSLTMEEIGLEFNMLREEVYAIKTAFSIIKQSNPYTDKEIDSMTVATCHPTSLFLLQPLLCSLLCSRFLFSPVRLTSLCILYLRLPYRDWETDRKSTRLNSSHITRSRMPSSA